MKNVITIQHTESIHHTNGMIGSWTDWELSEKGKEQAKRIGERLAWEIKEKKYVMYSSDLLRAKQTADIVASFLDIQLEYVEVLRELNLGEAVGKSEEWAHKNTIVWMKTIDDKPFIGSESWRDVWNRLIPFYNKIMEEPNENIILVSHGGTLRIFNAIWLGLDIEMYNKGYLNSGADGVSFMHVDPEGLHCINRLNDRYYVN
jgi:probable phosphoglycerate mutase